MTALGTLALERHGFHQYYDNHYDTGTTAESVVCWHRLGSPHRGTMGLEHVVFYNELIRFSVRPNNLFSHFFLHICLRTEWPVFSEKILERSCEVCRFSPACAAPPERSSSGFQAFRRRSTPCCPDCCDSPTFKQNWSNHEQPKLPKGIKGALILSLLTWTWMPREMPQEMSRDIGI